MKFKHTITTAEDLEGTTFRLMRGWFKHHEIPKGGLDVIMRPSSHSRSARQNALSHAWYAEVEKAEGEYTADQVKRLCKLHYGVPILRGDDEEFNEFFRLAIDPLPYENQVKAMRFTPVTSMMNTSQMSRYLEAIQQHYLQKGIPLEFPDDY